MVIVQVRKTVIECLLCKTQATGDNLKEALENLTCKTQEKGIDPFHRAALMADGKSVFKLEQAIKDEQKGKSIVDVDVSEKEAKKLTPAKPEFARQNKPVSKSRKKPPKEPEELKDPKEPTEPEEDENPKSK